MSLITIEDYIYDLLGIFNVPISTYKRDLDLIKHFYDFSDIFDPLACDKTLLKNIVLKASPNNKRLFISYDGTLIFYVIMRLFDGSYIIAGPLIDSKEDLTEHVRFNAIKHGAKVRPITRCSKSKILSAFSLIYKAMYKKSIDINSLKDSIKDKDNDEYLYNEDVEQVANVLMRLVENNTPHNDKSYEIKIRRAIEHGDNKALYLALNTPFVGKRGIIGFSHIRNHKNLAIVDITIASRAAIDAGVDSELAYVISDSYILQVEKAKTSQEAEDIYKKCAFEFCSLVKETLEHKFGDNKIVRDIIAYLEKNFYKKITIKDIAHYLNLSSEHIQRVFKDETQMTINTFLLDLRLNKAKVLLDGTDKSIYEIAHLTGFSTESYFIKLYKNRFSITPKSYRKYLKTQNLK